jgi:hypothetical protein
MIFDNKVLNSMFLNRVKRVCIAATPKDTGNLAYNALIVHPTNDGFSVKYKSSVAGYGVFLNDYRKLRGFAQGSLNPHYLWFDSGVHQNILNEILRTVTKSQSPKKDKLIKPTPRTFEDSSIQRKLSNNDGSQVAKDIRNEKLQYETFKDWNSRFDEFKNHNGKGWGI